VSYTYRTDKLLDAIGNAQGLVNQRNCPKQWVGFAIELETELQEATFEIERLRKANLQLQEGAEQQKQRIKRLEEMYEGKIGENEQFLESNLQGLLTRELNEANDRIKRLDETLEAVTDKIDTAWGIYMEFKEAKP